MRRSGTETSQSEVITTSSEGYSRIQALESIRVVCRHILCAEIGNASADVSNGRVVQHISLILVHPIDEERIAETGSLQEVSLRQRISINPKVPCHMQTASPRPSGACSD